MKEFALVPSQKCRKVKKTRLSIGKQKKTLAWGKGDSIGLA